MHQETAELKKNSLHVRSLSDKRKRLTVDLIVKVRKRNKYKTKKNKLIRHSNMTSFFRFVNKRERYPFGIISLVHVPVNVTDFSIGA